MTDLAMGLLLTVLLVFALLVLVVYDGHRIDNLENKIEYLMEVTTDE